MITPASHRARLLARPVHQHVWTELPGRVLGGGPEAAYIQARGLVIALTAHRVPLMPNGIALPTSASPATLHSGDVVRIRPGRIDTRSFRLIWPQSDPPLWDPQIVPGGWSETSIRSMEGKIAALLGMPPVSDPESLAGAVVTRSSGDAKPALDAEAMALLLQGVRDADARLVEQAAARLVGLGAGLTPEGDDVLAATAATISALGMISGYMPPRIRQWLLAGLVVTGVESRTTALAATLLRLAVRGCVLEPVQHLLRPQTWDGSNWRRGVEALLRIGHTTGLVYALQIVATARMVLERSPAGATTMAIR